MLSRGWNVVLLAMRNRNVRLIHPDGRNLLSRVLCAPDVPFPLLWEWIRRPLKGLKLFAYVFLHGQPRLGAITRSLYSASQALYFDRQIEGMGLRHLHAHFGGRQAEIALYVSRLSGIGFSYVGHSQDVDRDYPLDEEKVAQARFIVTSSQLKREVLLQKNPQVDSGKVHVIRTGVDLHRFPAREGVPRENGNPLILCVTRLDACKGVRYLIEACALLLRAGVPFECVRVGEGSEAEQLRTQARDLGLDGRVSFKGHLPDAELLETFKHATVFALPCVESPPGIMDGLPVVLIETMAMEIPVVSTRISAIPELIDDDVNGCLVTPGSSSEIAAALQRLISNPKERRRLGQMARVKVTREFNIIQCVEQLDALVQSALQNGQAGSEPEPGQAER